MAYTAPSSLSAPLQVESDKVLYSEEFITSKYDYNTVDVQMVDGKVKAVPKNTEYTFRTERKAPKLGCMIVGWGGNNGSTVTAACVANKEGITWQTKDGVQTPDYFGSLTQASVVRLGADAAGNDVHIPFKNLVPMVDPNEMVIGGWDISSTDIAESMKRAQVLDYDLQRQLYPKLKSMKPLPSVYYPDFIAANQGDRADNVLKGSKADHLAQIRKDIQDFKKSSGVDKVVVIWSANTERFADIIDGVNTKADDLMKAIENGHDEVAPSQIFAVASILEGCTYINGSPQNTFVPAVVELAKRHDVRIAGDDFKSGQTKMKSVLVDFLVSAGIKPESIVSYNHLGNNDGKNLSAPQQFRSKEISKSNVVDDMVASNSILYPNNEHPDHCVVIKYVPAVADSKRAMDEYTSRIFMGGKNTIVMHNTCEDSLLAAPLILDLVILGELCDRIQFKTAGMEEFDHFHPVLSILGYLLKAPLVPEKTPLVNALFRQRACIENILRACVGLPPDNMMLLEFKNKGIIEKLQAQSGLQQSA
eukprot:TRINITY_DN8508_c1_g1_i1.p1 TRINITY_DN8508_c1_g1~~TRINITY_DN8508_c1_g1_i1.p1  ORF type:complete len:541 (+),score=198.30 TRINITY_DN8508_c1_g1_i1:27-1625(+)